MTLKHPKALCTDCPLKDAPYVRPVIDPDSDILLIGTSPGSDEVRTGVSFTGPTGQLLDLLFPRRASKTNLVACYSDGPLNPQAVLCCKPKVDSEIEQHKNVMLLGTEATQRYLNQPISKCLGQRKGKFLANMQPASLFHYPDGASDFITICEKIDRPPFSPKIPKYSIPVNRTELKSALNGLKPVVCYDIETDDLQWYDTKTKPRSLILNLTITDGYNTLVIPYNFFYTEPTVMKYRGGQYFHYRCNFEPSQDILNDFFSSQRTFIAHNAKFDDVFLRSVGVNSKVTFDTMLAHHLLKETPPHDLKSLASLYLDAPDYDDMVRQLGKLRGKGVKYSNIPQNILNEYAAKDVYYTLELYKIFEEQIEKDKELSNLFYTITMPLCHALSDAEFTGVKVDVEHLRTWKYELEKRKIDLTNQLTNYIISTLKLKSEYELELLYKRAENYSTTTLKFLRGTMAFNPNSPQMMSFVMYEVFNFPKVSAYNVKEGSTSRAAIDLLVQLDPNFEFHPIIEQMTAIRRTKKVIGTYINPLIENCDTNDRFHESFNIHGTEIGRLSSSTLLLIPRPDTITGNIIRSAFIPGEGNVLFEADYSQLELRTAGVVSGDQYLMNVYRENRDLHTETTVAYYGPEYKKAQRSAMKTVNFKLQYSFNPPYSPSKVMTEKEFYELVEARNKLTHQFQQYKLDVYEKAVEEEVLSTRWGRKRRFPLVTEKNEKEVMKSAVHFMVSSSGADGTNLSVVRLHQLGYTVLLPVHDSVILELDPATAEEDAKVIVKVMEDVLSEVFPEIPWVAEGEIKNRWAKLPKFDSSVSQEDAPVRSGEYLLWPSWDNEEDEDHKEEEDYIDD